MWVCMIPIGHHVGLLMLMIVDIVRERSSVSPVTQSGPGAMSEAGPVPGAGAGAGEGAGVHCSVKHITEA